MKLFHGTTAVFEKFELPQEGVNHEYYGKAIYFTDNYETASYYGDRIITIDIPKSVITKTIDAKGHGMKQLDGLREMVDNEGVIEVKNVADYNLEGAQVKHFPIDTEDCGEYKFFSHYFVSCLKLTKSVAENYASILTDCGVKNMVVRNIIFKGYNVNQLGIINREQALAASARGVPVLKAMRKTPQTATIVIFAGEQGLNILHHYCQSQKSL